MQKNSAIPALPELIIKDFDDEQVWQQLELENAGFIESLLEKSARLLSNKAPCTFSSTESSKEKDTVAKKKGSKKKHVVEDEVETKITDDFDINDLPGDSLEESADNLSEDDDLGEVSDEAVEIDKNDKFFDFTGDSDEDLNFDFGPLGQKGNLDEKLFEKDESDDSDAGNRDEKHLKKSPNKKSVSFDDSAKKKRPKSQVLKKFEASEKSKKRGSVVDDKFFKLADLEAFLEREDKREERRLHKLESEQKGKKSSEDDEDTEDEDEIDMFGDIVSEDEVRKR